MFCRATLPLSIVGWIALLGVSNAADPGIAYQPLAPGKEHVSRTVLPLVHTSEVQQELGLTGDALEEFLRELRAIDAVWWPARIKPADEIPAIVAGLEERLIESLRKSAGEAAVARLRQLELQAQGFRALARPEVAEFLKLTPAQKKRLTESFAKTDKAVSAGGKTGSAEAPRAAQKAEQSVAKQVLTSQQTRALVSILGEPLETSALERIYPLAPELIDSGHWTTDDPITLASLKGRVVLVHFYAFQCHNCVANFPHYKRWHESLAKKGVSVIGIQTPETPAEHDVQTVKDAARENGFEFPVLIDVKNQNWDAWGNTMWPTVYVIDKQGYIRSWWQGELNWDGATGDKTIEGLVDKLLAE